MDGDMNIEEATQEKATPWRNRIVGHGEEAPADLMANPKNWRIHPQAQKDALESLLDGVGWVDQIIVNRKTGFVVDGHLRVALSLQRDEKMVPVQYVELDEEEEALVLVVLDPLAAMAATDRKKLASLMESIQSDDEQIQALLGSIAETQGVVPPMFDPVDLEEQPRLDRKSPFICPECGAEFTN